MRICHTNSLTKRRRISSPAIGVLCVCFAGFVAAGIAGADETKSSAEKPAATTEPTTKLAPDEYYRTLGQARDMYAKRRFDKAAELYAALNHSCPDDGENWARLAECLALMKQHAGAIDAYSRAVELGAGQQANVAHQIARSYTHLGETENALVWLERSLEERLENRSILGRDTQLKTLRGDERFHKITARLPEGELSREEGWRFDLALLAEEARRMHADPDRPAESEAFETAVEALDARIEELTDEQIVFEMQRLIVLLGDGHSAVYPMAKTVQITRLPIDLYLFSDGLFIVDAAEAQHDLIGSRVTKFGNNPSEKAIQGLVDIVSRDNPMGIKWLGPYYLTFPSVLDGLGLVDDPAHVNLTLVDRDRNERVVELEGGPLQPRQKLGPPKQKDAPPAPRFLRSVQDAFWFEHLSADETLYVQFNQVRNKREQTIEQFALDLREFIDSADVDFLILDLRHNNGGNTYLTIPLLRTLIHFQTNHGHGKLFVLAGRSTFSACMNFATDIDRLTDAIFVGEPTGSRPNFPGESTTVILPYSGVRASISTRYWQQSWPTDRRLWIAPEIPVTMSSADYFSGRDPALEALLKMIRQGQFGDSPQETAGE